MRVLVCGGRNFEDRQALNATLDRLHQERGFFMVIAGGARGADTLGEEWASAAGLPCTVFQADWAGLGRKAGPIGNQRMLDEGQAGISSSRSLVVAAPRTWCALHVRPASR